MKFSDEHIIDYLEGRLSPSEENIIERAAQDDAFLNDVIEGYRSNPGGLQAFKDSIRRKRRLNNLGLGVLGIAVIILAVFLVNRNSNKQEENLIVDSKEKNQIADTTEHEKIDEQILAFKPIAEEEQVNIEEVKVAQHDLNPGLIENSEQEFSKDSILITESIDHQLNDLEIETEEHLSAWGEGAPYTYMYDLFVVDYRKIKRVNKSISYTRMELTGLSAAQENEDSQQELVEVEVEVSYWEYLDEGMKQFNRGDYTSALNRFEIIVSQYPEDLNALFYGGLCYYNFGQFEKAKERFTGVMNVNLNAFKEEALWFKTKCFIELGNIDSAKELLDQIIMGGGFYSEQAIHLKKNLN